MGKRIVIVLLLAGILGGMLALPAGAVDLQLAAPSAVLMDLATGTVLYETNSHERLAPASVTKVMTLLLIMEAVDSGKISWQDTVTASEAAAAKGGSQVYLKVGETMSVEEMVKSITVSSANDCACAMAEFLAGSEAGFVEKMNARAKELGMEDTHFVNCTGLDDEPSAAEHLTSAYDIALMSRELLLHHPDIKKFTTIWIRCETAPLAWPIPISWSGFTRAPPGSKPAIPPPLGTACLPVPSGMGWSWWRWFSTAPARRTGSNLPRRCWITALPTMPWCRCRRESPSPRFR